MPNSLPLSDWFDLRRYARAKDWNLPTWFWAVSSRLAQRYLSTGRPDRSQMTGEFFVGLAVDLSMPTGTRYMPDGSLMAATLFLDPSFAGRVVVDISNDIDESAYYEDMWRFWQDGKDYPVRGSSAARFLSVNLAAPNAVLLEQFSTWLMAMRTLQEPRRTRPFSTSDLQAWADSQALAYIDLCLWRDCYGVKLTQPEIASLLFPDDFGRVDAVERVRKVTAKHAKLMTSSAGFAMLEAQAADHARKTGTGRLDSE